MNRRQKIIVSVTGIFIVLLILIGLTYAYFLTRITGNSNPTSISVTTANLELVYGDGTTSILTSATPIEPGKFSSSKDFTVTNNGNVLTDYAVTLEDFSITYANDTVIDGVSVKAGTVTKMEYPSDMKMEITCTIESDDETRNGQACGNINGTLPTENSILLTNSIEVDNTHKYVLTLTYIESEIDQSADMNKTIKGKIDIIDPKSTIDLAGIVASYQTGDYVEINSTPIKSEIVDGKYILIGVEPGNHTLYVKYKDANGDIQTRGSQSLIIKKGDEANVSGNTITFTDASRVAIVNVIESYGITFGEIKDFDPYQGILAINYTNGRNIDITTNTIVEDVDIKTQAIEYPFSVTNVGSTHRNLTIKLTDIKIDDELKNIDFRWGLYNADTNVGLSFGMFKYVENNGEEIIYRDTIIDAAEPNITKNYILRIWVHNNGTAQTELLNKKFSAKIQIDGAIIEYTPEECFEIEEDAISGYKDECSRDLVLQKKFLSADNLFVEESFKGKNLNSVILPELNNYFFWDNVFSNNNISHLTFTKKQIGGSMGVFSSAGINTLFIAESNGDYLFGYDFFNNNIKNVVIPGTFYAIGDYSFANNPLTDVIIMDGITVITSNSFDGTDITSIEIPKSVTTIYGPIFADSKLEKIILRGKTEIPEDYDSNWNCINWGDDGCIKVAEVEFRP